MVIPTKTRVSNQSQGLLQQKAPKRNCLVWTNMVHMNSSGVNDYIFARSWDQKEPQVFTHTTAETVASQGN